MSSQSIQQNTNGEQQVSLDFNIQGENLEQKSQNTQTSPRQQVPVTFGVSLAPPLPSAQGTSQPQDSNTSPQQTPNTQNREQLSSRQGFQGQPTLSEVQELLSYLRAVKDTPPPMEQNKTNTITETQVQERILVPSFNLDEYRGKSHVFEFLQYLNKQKCLLISINIPEIQKKILLNNKLPGYISNNMLSVVNDPSVSISKYVEQIAEYYGPKKDDLRQQLMSQSINRYENYISFIHKCQEMAAFAQVSEQQLLFILECRLPKHIAGYIKECTTISQYVLKLQSVFQEGWFSLIDDQFRQTIKRQENKTKPYEENKNFKNPQQDTTNLNSGPKTAVAFLGVDTSYQTYPANVTTRAGAKRQHIDNDTSQQFINQQYQENLQKQNQTQQQQSPSRQNGVEQLGTSNQHKAQQEKPEENEALKKLFEKARQNAQNLPEKINKGPRNKRFVNEQEDLSLPKPVTLDAQRYLNQAQQVNLTQVLKDVCVPVPLNNFFNLIGFSLQQKQDQSVPNNAAYFQQLQDSQYQPICGKTSQASQNTTSQNDNSAFYNQNFQKDGFSENQVYQFFYNSLSEQQNKPQVSETKFVDYLQTSENTEHLCIPLTINNQTIIGITDSGAQQTIMSMQAAERAGILNLVQKQPEEQQGISITGCTGSDRILGVIPRLNLLVQGYEVAWKDILIQSNATFDLLVGLDVLALFDFVFHIKDRVVSFVPYPDDPRVVLDLCSSVQSNSQPQGIRKAYYSYITFDTKTDNITEYISRVNTLYPNFPFNRTYNLIYMDPAWFYTKPMFTSKPPYKCLTFSQLKLLPIEAISDSRGCILVTWSTGTHLKQCLDLINFWKFNYINILLVWKKSKVKENTAALGLGYYSRSVYEFLIISTKGKVSTFKKSKSLVSNVSQELETSIEVLQPRSKFFSRKPYEVYGILEDLFEIERMRCIEIFATERSQFNKLYDLYGSDIQPNFQKSTYFQKSLKIYTTKKFYNKASKILYQYYLQSFEQIQEYCEKLNIGPNIDSSYIKKLQTLIKKYADVYKFDNRLTLCNLGEAEIQLKPNTKPIKGKPYKLIGEPYNFIKAKFEQLEKDGLIVKGKSPWGTPVMTVPKDSPTEPYRAVQNFKKVNNVTVKDRYPLRLIELILLKVARKRFKCTFDLRGGFNQIKRSRESMEIMAMILPWGLYLPVVMWFGETNAPSIFQRIIDLALSDLYDKGVECYIDDIIVCADTLDELLYLIEQIFIRLERANLKLHPDKCTYFVTKATVLGHEIDFDTMEPKTKKIKKLQNISPPTTPKQLQQFMGSINYYRKFIPDLALIMIPFQESLSQTNSKLFWNENQIKAFEIIKNILSQKLILNIPDISKQFKVVLSYTKFTYNTALVQLDNLGNEYVCAFHSQHQPQNNSQITQLREIDCLIWSLNEWRPYIQHQQFIVQTDLHALKYLYECKTNNLKLLTYQLELQDLVFEVENIPVQRLRQLLLLTTFKEDTTLLDNLQNSYEQLNQNLSISSKQTNIKTKDNKGTPFEQFDYILQFDGASQKVKFNQSVGAGAFVIFNSKHKILHFKQFDFIGAQTNNCAEYAALIEGLTYLISQNYNKYNILIQGDSQLIIKQVTYEYMCNSETLTTLCQKARELLKLFKTYKIQHIDRKYNYEADSRAKAQLQILKQKILKQTQVFYANIGLEIDLIKCQVCDQCQPEETMVLCDHCNLGFHIDCIKLENIPISEWYCKDCMLYIQEINNSGSFVDPTEDFYLISFLKAQLGISDFKQLPQEIQQRVQQRANLYIYDNNKLYKKDFNNSLKEVPTVGERQNLVEQIHQLIGHLGINRTIQLIQQFFYWPKMYIQITNLLRTCDLCQAQNPQFLNMPQAFPINKKFGPMQCLYMDCFYLPRSKNDNRVVIIAICGLTKWVEARAIKTNNSSQARDFLFDDIICRYGCPLAIHSDRGSEFMREFKELCENLNIIQVFSSPYRPQTNGQIERMNRTIKNILTKLANCFQNHPHYDWEDFLPQAKMGINFTVSRASKFSPFQSLFAFDPVLPGFQAVNQNVTFQFPTEQEQTDFIFQKMLYKQDMYKEINQNLLEMENEITDVIQKRDKLEPSDLQYGQLVFIKREQPIYPQTKSTGPYVFLGYNNSERTSVMLINPKNRKIINVNITKISPMRIY